MKSKQGEWVSCNFFVVSVSWIDAHEWWIAQCFLIKSTCLSNPSMLYHLHWQCSLWFVGCGWMPGVLSMLDIIQWIGSLRLVFNFWVCHVPMKFFVNSWLKALNVRHLLSYLARCLEIHFLGLLAAVPVEAVWRILRMILPPLKP